MPKVVVLFYQSAKSPQTQVVTSDCFWFDDDDLVDWEEKEIAAFPASEDCRFFALEKKIRDCNFSEEFFNQIFA